MAMDLTPQDVERRRCCRGRTDWGNWYLLTAKLAAAVAIIRSKPPGRCGRQQAEFLACQLCRRETDWKARAQGLEEEVLRLRKQLLLAESRSSLPSPLAKLSGRGAAACQSSDPLSLDLQDSVTTTPTSDKDSGCGTGDNSEVFLSVNPGGDGDARGRAVLLHTRFLQGLVGLRVLGSEDSGSAVVVDTVSQLLSCMAAVCRNPQLPTVKPLLLQAAQAAARAADCVGPLGELLTRVEDSIRELSHLLLSDGRHGRFQMQETLAHCLLVLGSSSSLKPALIHQVLGQILDFGDRLCQMEGEGLLPLDVARYENSFYLFWILEQMVWGGECAGLTDVLGRLERQSLHLSHEFPLFAIYAWRVRACVEGEGLSGKR